MDLNAEEEGSVCMHIVLRRSIWLYEYTCLIIGGMAFRLINYGS
jgi:hypothetical protein